MKHMTWLAAIILAPICSCLLCGQPDARPEAVDVADNKPGVNFIILRRLPTLTPTPTPTPFGGKGGAGGEDGSAPGIDTPGVTLTPPTSTASPSPTPYYPPTITPTPTSMSLTPTSTISPLLTPHSPAITPTPSPTLTPTPSDGSGESTKEPPVEPPIVAFSASTYSLNENEDSATITVALSAASAKTITVDYTTGDNTAIAGSDYTATRGTLTINPGFSSVSFPVPIIDDKLSNEFNETVNLTLNNPGNARLGTPNPATLTIVDDDGQPTVQFDSPAYNVNENVDSGQAIITVTLSAESAQTITVDYTTKDITATAGNDYIAIISRTLTFDSYQTTATLSVPVTDDLLAECDEDLQVKLSSPSNNVQLGAPILAMLTIVNDDFQPTTTTDDDYTTNCNCTLREAIIAANTDTAVDVCPAGSGPDTITLMAGAYVLTLTGPGENYAHTDDLDITDSLTIIGAGPGMTIIDASVLGDRVFHILTSTVVISGVTIANGSTNDADGGGINNNGGNLTLTYSTVSGNRVEGDSSSVNGGGIHNSGILTLTYSIVSGNRVEGDSNGVNGGGLNNSGILMLVSSTINSNLVMGSGSGDINGGGLHNGDSGIMTLANSTVSINTTERGGGIFNRGNLTLIGSTIRGNTAITHAGGIDNFTGSKLTLINSTVSSNTAGAFGGGLNNHSNSIITLTNSTISSNTAGTYGGGLNNYMNGTVTLVSSTVSSNKALDNRGGGILNSGLLMLTNSTVSSNTAPVSGGGINNRPSARTTLINSTVSGNTASNHAGGIDNRNGVVTLTNSTVSGNTTNNQGGGVSNHSNGKMTLLNSTISGNRAISHAGGIDNWGGTVTLSNTIVANNLLSGDCWGDIISDGYNLDSDNTCNLTATGDITNTDPLLGPLQNNGGPTETHALLGGSPAINTSSPACPATDQRGVFRSDGLCDTGAYEFP